MEHVETYVGLRFVAKKMESVNNGSTLQQGLVVCLSVPLSEVFILLCGLVL